jgi:membrane associated rhomboid family serine protease
MIPIGDSDVRGAGLAIITIVLIAINVVVFVYEATLSQPELESFVQEYGVVPEEITQGEDLFTLLTSIFLHGGWLHLIGNMLFLWVFGDNIEHTLGPIIYPVFYILGGLAASAAHILLNPDSTIPSVGASGAIAAVLGAYLVMYPQSRVRVLVFLGYFATVTRITALIFLGIWFVMQLFNGVASLGVETAQTGGVAFWAHVGGFVLGVVVGFLFRGQKRPLEYERA